jgi:alkanesulfonate monooxygenase SsuD/methylene tetrahydromethanopterin reductase-like flavin-dependent oxidoreductase (luciferase family)
MKKNSSAKNLSAISISVLDLALVLDGKSIASTFANSVDLAQNVEKWGYKRYWLAEHHNMEGVASVKLSVI